MSLGSGLLGIGMSAAGAASSSYAAYKQVKAQNAAANWNAGMLDDNAKIKDIMAEQELQAGKHNVAVAKREGKLKIEEQRGAYAASGVKVDSGSSLDVVAEQAGRNKYDQDMLKYNSELAAWGHKVEGANLRQQATMTRATKQSPGLSAFSTLLSGSTDLYNQYRQYRLDVKK